jgi:GTPase SAR1 family protein
MEVPIIKILIMGGTCTGKTQLAYRFAKKKYKAPKPRNPYKHQPQVSKSKHAISLFSGALDLFSDQAGETSVWFRSMVITQGGPPPVTKRTLYRSGTAISSQSLENCVDMSRKGRESDEAENVERKIFTSSRDLIS